MSLRGWVLTLSVVAGVSSCSEAEPAGNREQQPVQAASAVIALTEVPGSFEAPGTIRARSATVLSSKGMGRIVMLNVREGDRVRQGQVVAEIENREAVAQVRAAAAGLVEAQRGREEAEAGIRAAEAGLRAAEAGRDLALSTRNRYDILRDRRSVSPQEYDEAETRHKAAVQEVERAREGLSAAQARRLQVLARIEQAEAGIEAAAAAQEHSRIVSPLDGIVSSRTGEPGMLATPGLPLLAIEDPRTYELEVSVEEARIGAVRVGQTVRLEIDALGRAAMAGRVREIAPASDPGARTYAVKLQFTPAAPDAALRSGLFGRAIFPAASRQALVVPQAALVRRGQLEGVFVVENDVAVFRLVKTGKEHEQGIEVLSGLAPGARILTSPAPGISDGARITP